MSNHNEPDTFADDETIVYFVGGGADHQAVQLEAVTSHRSNGVPEVHGEDVLENFHNRTDPAGLADLRLPLYDVEHFDLNADDSSILAAQSEPWDPGRVSSTARQGTHRHAPSNPATFTSDATRREVHQYSSSGYGVGGRFEAQHAHSSTNGISQWDDLSTGHESPEEPYGGHGVESAPISSPSPSVWSRSGRIQRYLSSATQSSQPATQARETRSHGAAATSTTRSVRSAQRKDSSFQTLSGSTAFEDFGSSSVEVSADPPSNADATTLHVCFPCNKIFPLASGLRHHRQTHDEAKMNTHRCPTCQRGFRYPKDVERHLTTHKKTKKHHCTAEGCSKTFTRKDNAKRHSETHSTGS